VRVTELVRAESLRYAVVEIFLIVVGILLALAASDRVDRRAERRAEREILTEMRQALAEDAAVVDGLASEWRDAADRMRRLEAHIESGAAYSDSLDALFGAPFGLRVFLPNRAAYESLKSQGLGLVSDPSLLSLIVRVYEQVYVLLAGLLDLETNIVLEALRPYYLTHFRQLRFNISATPIDYEAVVHDPEFMNLLDYRLQNVVRGMLPPFEQARDEMNGLIDAIDRDLGATRPR